MLTNSLLHASTLLYAHWGRKQRALGLCSSRTKMKTVMFCAVNEIEKKWARHRHCCCMLCYPPRIRTDQMTNFLFNSRLLTSSMALLRPFIYVHHMNLFPYSMLCFLALSVLGAEGGTWQGIKSRTRGPDQPINQDNANHVPSFDVSKNSTVETPFEVWGWAGCTWPLYNTMQYRCE